MTTGHDGVLVYDTGYQVLPMPHNPFNDTNAVPEDSNVRGFNDWESGHGFDFGFDIDELRFEYPRPSPPLPYPPTPRTTSPYPPQPIGTDSQPYHVYNNGQKWVLIVIIGAAGLFSGLSSNIYFPAMDEIARDLDIGIGAVSLTITSYMIAQGISPLVWGSFSDTLGRRPIYMASFTVYIVANVALSSTRNYAVLLLFRALQAAGSASTVSIGNGVIQDISPPSERGSFIAFYQAIRNFSIAIGPVLGGVLAEFLGFRSIFGFLLALSSIVLAVIILLLPETLRSIAGNGSLRLTGIYLPLIQRLTKGGRGHNCVRYYENSGEGGEMLPRKKITASTFAEPLKLLGEKDILFNLLFGGVVYAVWTMVTSSTTRLFQTSFGLDEILPGLAFLPNGLGTIVGSAIVGKLMTRDFASLEADYRLQHDLLLQFIIAATSNAVFALNQTIVADLCPGRGASATAVNNLVRCGLGAVGAAVVDGLITLVGVAPTFLGLALLTVGAAPLAVLNWCWGMEWRAERARRKERMEGEKRERDIESGAQPQKESRQSM